MGLLQTAKYFASGLQSALPKTYSSNTPLLNKAGITSAQTANRVASTGPRPTYGPAVPTPTYNFPKPSVLGASTGGGGQQYTPTVNNTPQPAGQQTQYNDINQQVEDFGAIIDRDYETALGGLASQEQDLRGQAAATQGAITAGAAPVRTAIADTEATNLQGLSTQEQQTQTQSRSAIQQARDLFRETQQNNIAQLSGLGLSSSSVNEALAERLGVETARRIAGVTNSTNEIMQNISQERTRVQSFAKSKLAEVETNLQAQLTQVQQSLVSGLNQINQARQVAAADKANRRQELLSRAQSSVAQLQAQAQNFSQSLQMWETQKQSTLGETQKFVASAPDQSGLKSSINNIQGILGAGFTPELSFNTRGEVSGTFRKNKEEEDLLAKYGIQ